MLPATHQILEQWQSWEPNPSVLLQACSVQMWSSAQLNHDLFFLRTPKAIMMQNLIKILIHSFENSSLAFLCSPTRVELWLVQCTMKSALCMDFVHCGVRCCPSPSKFSLLRHSKYVPPLWICHQMICTLSQIFLTQLYTSSSWISFVHISNWALLVSYCVSAHGSICCEELHALRSRIIKIHILREAGSSPRARAKFCFLFLPSYPLLNCFRVNFFEGIYSSREMLPSASIRIIAFSGFSYFWLFLQNILALEFFLF